MSKLPPAPTFGPEADLELEAGMPVSPGGANSAHPGLRAGMEGEVGTSADHNGPESEPSTGTPREDTGERM